MVLYIERGALFGAMNDDGIGATEPPNVLARDM
jgi:hypothetical protein